MTDKKMIIMRGLPGSGKSTLAKTFAKKRSIFSADDYWYSKRPFSVSLLPRAHAWNQKRVRKAVAEGEPLIVVDNTNSQLWEMKPYVEDAVESDYNVEFVEVDTAWSSNPLECFHLCKHQTPFHVIVNMKKRFEHHATIEGVLQSKPLWE